MPLEPQQVNFNRFREDKVVKRNDTDFSIQLLYYDQTLEITTDYMKILFNLLEYTNPGGKYTNYSTSIALSEKANDPFNLFLNKIDTNMQSYIYDNKTMELTDYKYDGPIKQPRENKSLSHLRVKILSNATNLKFEVYEGDAGENLIVTNPEVKTANSLLQKGAEAKFKLLMKPIWFSTTAKGEKKYGYSWQLVAISLRPKKF